MTQYKKKQNRKPTSKAQSNLLNSVTIRTGTDTNILQKDIFREYHKDSGNTDQGQLISNKWIRFFGQDASFLKGLIAGLSNSPTKRNIISQKATLTLGDGFVAVKGDRVPFLQSLRKMLGLAKADDKYINEVNDLIANVNFHNESLEEVAEKLAIDYYSFGNAIAEFRKAKRDGKEVVLMYHVPIENAAVQKADNNGLIKNIGICDSWDNDGLKEEDITVVPIYPEFSEDGKSVVHIKDYSPNFFYWGIPSNIAGRFWAEIEYRIPKYNITKFKNGFLPSAIIQAYGSFTEDEAEKLAKSFKTTFSDTENGSRLLLQVLRSKTDASDIQIIEDKSDGSFMELQNLATQQIITSEGWFPSISGIAQPGKLGSSQELKDGIELAINMKIKPVRRKFLQKFFNPFISENRNVNSNIGNTMLTIANSNPISLASSIAPKDALTRNELREVLGYAPEEEQEVNQNQEQ